MSRAASAPISCTSHAPCGRRAFPWEAARCSDALRAVEAVGVARRDDFYWTLHAVFVRRADQRPLFDEAFHVFWRNPKLLERITSLLLPTVHTPPQGDARPLSRRLSEALFAGAGDEARTREAERDIELDATLTWSDREVLRARDFEQMSAAELAAAKSAIARLRLAIPPAPTRRYRPHPCGPLIDMRTTFRRSLRLGSGAVVLVRRRRLRKPAPIVVLCDISGSMSRYSRVLLHFAHALARDRTRVFSFVFGTRLTTSPASFGPRRGRGDRASERGGGGLERRHPHRAMPRCVQPHMVPPGLRPGRGGAPHLRRARPRRRRRSGASGGSGFASHAAGSCGSTPCFATRASSPRRPGMRALLPTWTSCARCTTSKAWRIFPRRF